MWNLERYIIQLLSQSDTTQLNWKEQPQTKQNIATERPRCTAGNAKQILSFSCVQNTSHFNKINNPLDTATMTAITGLQRPVINTVHSTLHRWPVCAHAIRSLLARTTGIEYFWTGVGFPYLHKAMLFSMISPNSTSANYTNSNDDLIQHDGQPCLQCI